MAGWWHYKLKHAAIQTQIIKEIVFIRCADGVTFAVVSYTLTEIKLPVPKSS
jgi:hypothetical protein